MNNFFPGSSYLYIRLYGSVMALEEWLVSAFPVILAVPEFLQVVDRWFYTRYLDPNFHLRVRFRLINPEDAGKILFWFNNSLDPWRNEHRIWKMETGTYQPEYLRYGQSRIDLAEQFFEVDSKFWLNVLAHVHENELYDQFWKVALFNVRNTFLDFKLNDEAMRVQLSRMIKSLMADFNLNGQIKRQLDEKFRNFSPEIESLMTSPAEWMDTLTGYWSVRSAGFSPIIQNLFSTYPCGEDLLHSNLIPDLVHMSMNRAFRSKHRIQELATYYFLMRWVESKLAREHRR